MPPQKVHSERKQAQLYRFLRSRCSGKAGDRPDDWVIPALGNTFESEADFDEAVLEAIHDARPHGLLEDEA